jgi:hypothetical protein
MRLQIIQNLGDIFAVCANHMSNFFIATILPAVSSSELSVHQ